MPLSGKLRTWHEDRGFGFIAPTDGGRELFVHISAFPRDGSRPVAGESLLYEVGPGKDGKPQAIRVQRRALGDPSSYPKPRRPRGSSGQKRSPLVTVVTMMLIVVLIAFGYSKYQKLSLAAAAMEPQPLPATEMRNPLSSSQFRCDGRTHCSQMTSCSEAKFFLANCPGTKMDGNNDGVPCEQQWCTGPLAK